MPSLTVWAEANQSEFYKLYARLIPTEVSGPDGGHIPLGGADIDTLRKELLQLAKTPEIKKFLDSARL